MSESPKCQNQKDKYLRTELPDLTCITHHLYFTWCAEKSNCYFFLFNIYFFTLFLPRVLLSLTLGIVQTYQETAPRATLVRRKSVRRLPTPPYHVP